MKTHRWKIILIAIIMLPMVVFFAGCDIGGRQTNVETTIKEPTIYDVLFYSGSKDSPNIARQQVEEGELVWRPSDPKKADHRFVGWYQDRECTILWNFKIDTVTGPLVLYAKWQKLEY